jgi:hypothetical protein
MIQFEGPRVAGTVAGLVIVTACAGGTTVVVNVAVFVSPGA